MSVSAAAAGKLCVQFKKGQTFLMHVSLLQQLRGEYPKTYRSAKTHAGKANTLMHRIPFCWNTCKIKRTVPVYTMKSYKGSHNTPPHILNHIAPSLEGWLCHRGDETSCSCQDWNPVSSTPHSSHCTDWAITACKWGISVCWNIYRQSQCTDSDQATHWKHLQVRLPSMLQTDVKNCMLVTSVPVLGWQALCVCCKPVP
jgi:hypothetical protein